jgi:hypothetical protein
VFSNNPQADEQVMVALKRGDKQALCLLYDKYAPALLGIIQKGVEDRHLAEETLQVCFIKIWQHKNHYNSTDERPFTCLLKITREVINKAVEKKLKETPNQKKELSVSELNRGTKTIMELVLTGGISEKQAAEKAGVSVIELREMIRKEINQLRGIVVE